MTKTVKGAGRSAAAGRRKKVERNEQRLAELKRDQAKAAEAEEGIARAKAAAKTGPLKDALHPKVAAFSDAAQESGWEVTARIDADGAQHLDCKRGEEVLHIFWLNGVYQKWATHTYGDGKPVRVQNAKSGLRVLGASAAEAKGAATKKAVAAKRTAPRSTRPASGAADSGPMTAEEKVAIAMADRTSMVWDDREMSDDEVLEFLQGKKIAWVNRLTGSVTAARIPASSKHNKIGYGKAGRNISFAAMEGPFMTAALDNIIKVN